MRAALEDAEPVAADAAEDSTVASSAGSSGDGGGSTVAPDASSAGDSSVNDVTAAHAGEDATVLSGRDDSAGDASGLIEEIDAGCRAMAPAVATGSDPVTIDVADLDGDGRLDLVVVNLFSGDVSVMLGNGDATFRPQTRYSVESLPSSVAIGDLNGDGVLDLAVANESSTDDDVSILLGNGDGTFQLQVPSYLVGSTPQAVAVGDFNGDAKLDVITANEGEADVSLLLGKGDGTFRDQVTFPVASSALALDVADFNHDGHLDVVVITRGTPGVNILLGDGAGALHAGASYAAGGGADAVGVGDLNDDGRLDLAVGNYDDGTVSVYLGNGDGTFQPQSVYPSGATPSAVAIVDATGDGKADIVAVNRGGTVNTVSVLAGNGDGTLGSPGAYPVDNSPLALATGDFDGDGKVDLAVTNIGTNDVSILVGACGKSWPNDGGAGGDATVADATAGDGGQDAGPATWCAEQGTHDFCEDFTEGVPGQMTVAWTPGATVTADTTNFSSPPRAMLTATPALTGDGGVAAASGSHGLRQTGAHFRMQADIRVDSNCFANGDYDRIMIMGVEYPTESYGMAMYVTPATTSDGGILLSAGTLEMTYSSDGGATIFSGQGDSGFFPPDEWQTFTMWADLPSEGGYGVSPAGIGVGGGPQPGPAVPYHAPTFWAGASVQNHYSSSNGCQVSVDNVLFDVGNAHIQ